MATQITDILDVLIIFQGLFLAFFLFTHRRPGAPRHLLLALFSLSLAFHFLNIFLLNRAVGGVINLGPTFGFLYGPLVFLYASSLLDPEFRLRWRDLFHLLPQLYALHWSARQFLSPEAGQSLWQDPTVAVVLSLTVYLALSLRRIAEFRIIVDLNRSSRDRALVSLKVPGTDFPISVFRATVSELRARHLYFPRDLGFASEVADLAAGRTQQSAEDRQQSRLARAVGPGQDQHLTRNGLARDRLENDTQIVALGHVGE